MVEKNSLRLKCYIVGLPPERDIYTYLIAKELRKKYLVIERYPTSPYTFFITLLKDLYLFKKINYLLINFYLPLVSIYGIFLYLFEIIIKLINAKIKIIITFHSLLWVVDPSIVTKRKNRAINTIFKKYMEIVVKLLSKESTYLLVHTRQAYKILQQNYNIVNIKFYPLGFYYIVNNNFSNKRNNIYVDKILIKNKDVVNFILFGNLRKEKGHKYLIRALPYVKKVYPKVCVIFAGGLPNRDSREYSQLKELAIKLNVFENIKFIGYIKDVSILNNLIDIAIFPYDPLVYLSASGAFSEILGILRVPCIVSNAPAFDIVVDNIHCIKVNPRDTLRLAQAIIELIFNKKKYIKLRHNVSKLITKLTIRETARYYIYLLEHHQTSSNYKF